MNNAVNINDCGAAYIYVSAINAFDAFSAALDYVAAKYPGRSFSMEGPFRTGHSNGHVVTGSGYILRESK